MSEDSKKIIVPVISAFIGGLVVFLVMSRSPNMQSAPVPPQPVSAEAPANPHAVPTANEPGVTVSKPGPLDVDPDKITAESVVEHEKDFQEAPEVMLPFDSFLNSKFGRDHAQNITKREDSAFVYFDIAIDDVKNTTLKTNVKAGYINVSGDTEKTVDDAVFRSTFKRTFPVPENAIANSLQTHVEKGKIILRFAKRG